MAEQFQLIHEPTSTHNDGMLEARLGQGCAQVFRRKLKEMKHEIDFSTKNIRSVANQRK
jgi:hypothetical protein